MNETQLLTTQDQSTILNDASENVKEMLKKELPEAYHFHNFSFVKEVAEICFDLANNTDLTQKEVELIQLAALFYVTGYTTTNDEETRVQSSKSIAEAYLKTQYINEQHIQIVLSLIESTRPGYIPQNLPEEIFHDARMAYAGKKKFFRMVELLRLELEKSKNQTYDEASWHEYVLHLLAQTTYYSKAASDKFEKRRQKNIKSQRNNEIKTQKLITRAKTGKDFGRGVDTLYRANYRNHINLSAIADGKANMMISINTIVLSVIVTLSGASLSLSKVFVVEHMRYILPILFLLIGALVSVVFAILSAKPAVTSKAGNLEDTKQNKTSLLYFGNFLQIPMEAFVEHLNELKHNQQRLYDSMSVDLYNLGKVLKRKYKLLSVSYNVFMIALIVSVMSFISIFLYTNY